MESASNPKEILPLRLPRAPQAPTREWSGWNTGDDDERRVDSLCLSEDVAGRILGSLVGPGKGEWSAVARSATLWRIKKGIDTKPAQAQAVGPVGTAGGRLRRDGPSA